MKCPVCEKTEKTSTVAIPAGGITTLLGWEPYFDEDGKLHHHNPNRIGYDFTCSNGHWGAYLTFKKCGACGWQARQDEIVVHGGMTEQECVTLEIPESMRAEYMESPEACKERLKRKRYDT